MKKTFENWAYHDYTTKLSVSIVYALIASVALNFFYQPGHIYSSGITGLAQILTTGILTWIIRPCAEDFKL